MLVCRSCSVSPSRPSSFVPAVIVTKAFNLRIGIGHKNATLLADHPPKRSIAFW